MSLGCKSEQAYTETIEDIMATIRPNTLDNYIGNASIKRNLGIAISAAKSQGVAVDNILVTGPAGTGKTTIAKIIANAMGTKLVEVNGAALRSAGAFVSKLLTVGQGDVLFIDEFHAVGDAIETLLYNVMEDGYVSITVGDKVQTVLRIALPHFTVVGATNRGHLLTDAVKQRFTIKFVLDFYTPRELAEILEAQDRVVEVDVYGLLEVAKRSRGTPRIAIANYKQASNAALAQGVKLTQAIAADALWNFSEQIDDLGCTKADRTYLEALLVKAYGGPRGLRALCNLTRFEEGQIEDIEAWLLHLGLIELTDEGRVATDAAYTHMAQFIPVTRSSALKGV